MNILFESKAYRIFKLIKVDSTPRMMAEALPICGEIEISCACIIAYHKHKSSNRNLDGSLNTSTFIGKCVGLTWSPMLHRGLGGELECFDGISTCHMIVFVVAQTDVMSSVANDPA